MKYSLVLISIVLLVTVSCSKNTSGSVTGKYFSAAHKETVLETQIVRGTLHDNVPQDYYVPDRYLVKVKGIDGKIREYSVKKAVHDTLVVGKHYTIDRKWKLLFR